MKIHADKVESPPQHHLRIRDIKLVLDLIPAEWIAELKEVRLANSLEHYSAYAFFSRYDGCLTIYSRRGNQEKALRAMLTALVVEVLGINRGIGLHQSEAEIQRINKIIQPILDKILPVMNSPQNSPDFHVRKPFPV